MQLFKGLSLFVFTKEDVEVPVMEFAADDMLLDGSSVAD